MKKKILAVILLATLAIGTLSPISSEAAPKKATTSTKTKAPTKIDGVSIKDLIAGKYNNINNIKYTEETGDVVYNRKKIFYTDHKIETGEHGFGIDKFYNYRYWLLAEVTYGKDYKGKTIDYGDGYIETYVDGDYLDTLQYHQLPAKEWDYSSDNEYTLKGSTQIYRFQLDSRKKEIARWKLDASRFKTTKTKVTGDELVLKGVYTLSVQNLTAGHGTREEFDKFKFDLNFWKDVMVNSNQLSKFKDVKCDATAVFYRDTKQLKSLELKAKFPKKGYSRDTYDSEIRTIYNASYTFEHQLTKAQEAERVSRITEEEMIEGKANEFETIDYEYKSNYGDEGPRDNWECTNIIQDSDIAGLYINKPYYKGDKPFSTGFDSSRFKITSSETNKNTTTITGVYKLNTDSNTIYDNYAKYLLREINLIGGNYNAITSDVTIVFDAKTKSMKKVTLQYNFDNVTLTNGISEIVTPGSLVCSTIYTFNNN